MKSKLIFTVFLIGASSAALAKTFTHSSCALYVPTHIKVGANVYQPRSFGLYYQGYNVLAQLEEEIKKNIKRDELLLKISVNCTFGSSLFPLNHCRATAILFEKKGPTNEEFITHATFKESQFSFGILAHFDRAVNSAIKRLPHCELN
jgi:hypothetical protein